MSTTDVFLISTASNSTTKSEISRLTVITTLQNVHLLFVCRRKIQIVDNKSMMVKTKSSN